MITLIGLDLGQQNDYTAICVVEATPTIYEMAVPGRDPEFHLPISTVQSYESTPVSYAVRHLERMNLGASYPDVSLLSFMRSTMPLCSSWIIPGAGARS